MRQLGLIKSGEHPDYSGAVDAVERLSVEPALALVDMVHCETAESANKKAREHRVPSLFEEADLDYGTSNVYRHPGSWIRRAVCRRHRSASARSAAWGAFGRRCFATGSSATSSTLGLQRLRSVLDLLPGSQPCLPGSLSGWPLRAPPAARRRRPRRSGGRRRVVQQLPGPVLGHAGILVLTQYVLPRHRRLDQLTYRFATSDGGKLAGAAQPLALGPQRVQDLVARVVASPLHCFGQPGDSGHAGAGV